MERKFCSKCKEEKELSEFYKDNKKKDGHQTICISCKKLSDKNYWITKRLETKEERERLKEEKRNSLKNRTTKICSKCHIEKPLSDFHMRGDKPFPKSGCKVCESIRYKLYRDKHPNKYKDWYYTNIKERSEYRSKYRSEKYRNDPKYRMICGIRRRIHNLLKMKNINKKNKSFNIVGCSPQELKDHMEKQFSGKMRWENYGYYGWHVDHIIPLDSGKTEKEILKLFHFTNLQPLWWRDNLSKGSKIL